MLPEKQMKIGNFLIQQYYWNGRLVIYVNHHKTPLTWNEAIDFYKKTRKKEINKEG